MLCNSCEKLNFKVLSRSCLNCGKLTNMYNICSLCDSCSQQLLKCGSCLKSIRKFKIDKSFCKSCGKDV